MNFALCGLGFISDRHIAAIEHIGGNLLCACDIDKQKYLKLDDGIDFFESFDDMANSQVFKDVDVVTICTPNDTHERLILDSLRAGKDVLCEKPTIIDPIQLSYIEAIEKIHGKKVFTVLQLRKSQKLQEMKREIDKSDKIHAIELKLYMARDDYYWNGWKGDSKQSGGLLFNIGVHYFDLMLWLFGRKESFTVDELSMKHGKGILALEKADVYWEIDLTAPKDNQHRIFSIDGKNINLTRILESLHSAVYEDLAHGEGIRLQDVRPVLELCQQMSYGH